MAKKWMYRSSSYLCHCVTEHVCQVAERVLVG